MDFEEFSSILRDLKGYEGISRVSNDIKGFYGILRKVFLAA